MWRVALTRGRSAPELAVEEVEHLLQAPPLGAVVGGPQGVALRVVESVVRGTTRQVDELEDLTLRPEPLQDVRVVGAGSTLGESLGCFHVAHYTTPSAECKNYFGKYRVDGTPNKPQTHLHTGTPNIFQVPIL